MKPIYLVPLSLGVLLLALFFAGDADVELLLKPVPNDFYKDKVC